MVQVIYHPISLDAVTHTYITPRGLHPTSVTTVLKDAGCYDNQYWTEAGAWRGSVVAKVCEMYDKHILDLDSVDSAVVGYFDAWRLFLQETGWISHEIERPIYSEAEDVAGTPDRIGLFPGTRPNLVWVLDIKSGALHDATRYQIAGYAMIYRSMDKQYKHPYPRGHAFGGRVAVRLQSNGRYKMHRYPLAELDADIEQFRVWKRQHGGERCLKR